MRWALATALVMSCSGDRATGDGTGVDLFFHFDEQLRILQIEIQGTVGAEPLAEPGRLPPRADSPLPSGSSARILLPARLADSRVVFVATGFSAEAPVARGTTSVRIERDRFVQATIELLPLGADYDGGVQDAHRDIGPADAVTTSDVRADEGLPDGPSADAPPMDAAPADGMTFDASPIDAGPDVLLPDTGVPDSPSIDAPCPPPLALCGTNCVDLDVDLDHCGTCDQACTLGAHATAVDCVAGSCLLSCDADWGDCNSLVSDGCEADLLADPNCGVCGNRCSPTAACVSGMCECTPGLLDCDATPGVDCRDTNADPLHCGFCGNDCDPGEFCNGAGVCVCRPGLMLCGGTCVDVNANPIYCGDCATSCMSGKKCSSGTCQNSCPAGTTNCSQGCVPDTSFSTHVLHCGGCGIACGVDEVCVEGLCQAFELAAGCTTCPCADWCQDPLAQCCLYPGLPSEFLCTSASDCP